MQVVAQLGQQRDNPWPAVEQVADHSEFGALGGDVCQCLLGVVGSAGRAQGGHQQPVGLQQRARAGLRLEPVHPGVGAVAGQAGLIGEQPANLGLIAQLGGDLTQSPIGERVGVLGPPRRCGDRQLQPHPLVLDVSAQPGKANSCRDPGTLVQASRRRQRGRRAAP